LSTSQKLHARSAVEARHLPNSLVRLAPDGFEVIKESAPDRRRPRDRRQAVQTGLKYCVGDFTVDIELELHGGGIANAHGTRAIEPGEPRHLPFDQASLPSPYMICS
jgi:hypothetical protein